MGTYRFDRGYASPYFINDQESNSAILEEPLILLAEDTLATHADVLSILDSVAKTGRSLLIIAHDTEGPAMEMVVINNSRRTVKAAVVKAPGLGDHQAHYLADLAAVTGAHLISKYYDLPAAKATLDHLGSAQRATVTKNQTTILDGAGNPDRINQRIKETTAILDVVTDDVDKKLLQERLDQLISAAQPPTTT